MPADGTLPATAPDDVVIGGFGAGLPASVVGMEVTAATTAASRRRLGWFFWVCAGWLILVAIGAIFAPALPLQPPNITASGALPFELPSIHHLLGTDDLGRDLFSRVVYGSRVSLVVGFGSISLGVFVGGLMGLVAGYVRGTTDTILSAVANVALAFPALILLLAVVAFLGQNLLNITLAVGVLSIAPIFRVVRGTTVSFADLEFVTAANGVGATRRRVLFREILPNVVPIVISYSLVFVAVSILAEAALSFLALSVALPTATWGGIVAEGKTYLSSDPYICLWPSIALFLTVLSLNFVGDRLRALFDVREAKL
ncbi:MAG TPA: ABC transporter permease [Mycobacteriales bacterium]